MLGLKTSINKIAIAALFAVSAYAADADFFPLNVRNQWVYKVTGFAGGHTVVVDIPRTENVNGKTYHVVRGLGGKTTLMRADEGGTLFAYDTETAAEGVYAEFAAERGQTYRTVVDPCSNAAVVRSRNADVKTPAGDFTGAFFVEYPSANCADAGLSGDYFVQHVGLVKRSLITIGGPRALELIYSRTGGVTTISAPEVSFSLTLDKARYSVDSPVITARMTFRVTEGEPITLTFPTSQTHDLIIYDESGKEATRWSVALAFLAVITEETFGPGEKNFAVVLDMRDRNLPAGKYIAEGLLTTIGAKTYSARVGFEITR